MGQDFSATLARQRWMRERWWLAAAVAAGVMIVSVTSPFGIGLSRESASYVSAAKGIASGEGFVRFDGGACTDLPPLVPACLAAFQFAGVDPFVAARFANAGLYALAVFFAGLWVLRRTGSIPLAMAGLCVVFLPVPLLRASVALAGEPAFDLFVLLTLLCLARHLSGEGEKWFWLSGVFATLAALTSWAVLPLAFACVAVLLLDLSKPRMRRAAEAIAFALVSCLPAGLWVLRNLAVTGTMTGPRTESLKPFAANLRAMLHSLSVEMIPPSVPPIARYALFAGAALLVVVLVARLIRRRADNLSAFAPMLAFVVAYPVFMLAVSGSALSAPDGFRLLSPIYLPAVLLVFAAIDGTTEGIARASRRRMVEKIAALALLLWCLYPATRMLSFIERYCHDGPALYTTKAWRGSETIRYLKGRPPEGTIWSNEPEAIYLLLGRRAERAPRGWASDSPGDPGELDASLRALKRSSPATLVWFEDMSEWGCTPEDPARLASLAVVGVFADGAVYSVRQGPPDSSTPSPPAE